MLDPLFEWMAGLWRALIKSVYGLWRLLTSPFRATYHFFQRSGWIIRGLLLLLLIPLALAYAHFIWHTVWIRDYNVDYPSKYQLADHMHPAGEQVAVEGGETTTKTCGRSNIVEVTADLIDFNVNRNKWISSHPLYKAGLFWIIEWDQTWFFDNKAAFQRGVHQAASRTAIELADALGRTRGTSQIDTDLKVAKGNIQFDQFTWYFNLFDRQPIGPTTPTPTYYREAFKALADYNKRLTACNATFDARADNLLQFLDRIAKDIGSTSAAIKDRAEQNNSGWFDTRADDIFMYSKGQLYGYYGILQAARADFPEVVENRALADIWDRMDEHLRRAIELEPFIISNGDEDGWLMPTHLTTLGFYILRARSNLVEIRSVLDR
ncbi:MAG: DUF2333 family protein [Hyphomicrobiaceae bacterium]|nr:DUF2333 family protein [Hyphomicrobiaceae bacterium]